MKNRFKNPADSATYSWHINQAWEGEETTGIEGSFTWASSTGGTPLPQYGGSKAELRTFRGTILHKAQHEAFLAWAALSEEHTIYFRDVDGDEFEVVILKYAWRRIGVARNLTDPTMPSYIYRYEMQMLFYGEVA